MTAPINTAAQMRDVQLVAALAEAKNRAELDAARLAAIRSGRLGARIAPPRGSEAHLVLAGIDPRWEGTAQTLCAWVSRVTARKALEFGRADGTAAPAPAGLYPAVVDGAPQPGTAEFVDAMYGVRARGGESR